MVAGQPGKIQFIVQLDFNFLLIISAILNSNSVSIIKPVSSGISYGTILGIYNLPYFSNFSIDSNSFNFITFIKRFNTIANHFII